MEQNEPSTEEIVRALKELESTAVNAKEKVLIVKTSMVADWIARLESLQRTVSDKDAQIACLTARAEQTERERDEAINVVRQNVKWQEELIARMQELTKLLRGQPQEGERE